MNIVSTENARPRPKAGSCRGCALSHGMVCFLAMVLYNPDPEPSKPYLRDPQGLRQVAGSAASSCSNASLGLCEVVV